MKNNFVVEFAAFMDDILNDRPRNNAGEFRRFFYEDRKALIDALNEQKRQIKNSNYDEFLSSQKVILKLYDVLIDALINREV